MGAQSTVLLSFIIFSLKHMHPLTTQRSKRENGQEKGLILGKGFVIILLWKDNQ